MPTLEQQVVECARSWVGTRFRHQGRSRNGVDCLGLLVMIAQECELKHGDIFLSDCDETNYGIFPDIHTLKIKLEHYLQLIPLDEARIGDVLLLEMDGRAQHLGIISDYCSGYGLIHAYAPARTVVEHRLDQNWIDKIAAAFRFY